MSRASGSEVDSLATVFEKLIATNEFKDMDELAKTLGRKLKRSGIEVTNKEDFATDLEKKLSETDFVSVEEGLELFDDLHAKTETYYLLNSEFYEVFFRLEPDEVFKIIQPSLGPMPNPPLVSSRCTDDCIGGFEANIATINMLYANNLLINVSITHSNNQVHVSIHFNSQALYYNAYYNFVDDFATCVGSC